MKSLPSLLFFIASVAISIDGGQGGAESGGDPDLEGVPEDGEWDTFQEVEPGMSHLFIYINMYT